jgi:copper chaperone CopZ
MPSDSTFGRAAEKRMAEPVSANAGREQAAKTGASVATGTDVHADRFVLIRIEGMHCHKCEQMIKKQLQRRPGVHEVEVDFASGQASILFDADVIGVGELVDAVKEAGYKPVGFTQSQQEG